MKQYYFLFGFIFFYAASYAQFKLYEQGVDAYNQKDYLKAISSLNEYLDKITRDKAIDVEVHYILALSYFKTNSFTSSVREFDEALQAGHKNTGNIHWFMGKGYSHLKAYKESIDEYTQAIALIADKKNQAKLYFERSLQHQKLSLGSPFAKDDIQKAYSLDQTNIEIDNARAALLEREREALNQSALAGASTDSRNISSNKKNSKGEPKKKDTEVVEKKVAEDKKALLIAEVIKPTETTVASTEPARKSLDVNKSIPINQTEKKVVSVTPTSVSMVEAKLEPTLADLYKDEKRYALVIGNSAYKFVAPLKNSANDANDMAEELTKLKFDVIKIINGDYGQMREAYRKFQEKLVNGPKDQTIGLFYYAGHGLQNEGESYLVPVEADIKYEDDIPRACFALQRVVVANMERSSSRMNIVILDACRNNPFPSAYRSGGGGLAEIKRAKGSFIAFATAPGSVASDGEGRNGLYTQELLKAMQNPGRTIEQVFKDVRVNVMKQSGERQFTWDQSNIIGDFYFKF